jgi:hypothetical protein
VIRCKVQVYLRKKKAWKDAVKLGTYKRVEDARKAMYAVKAQFHVPARLLSQYGTVVDATYIEEER